MNYNYYFYLLENYRKKMNPNLDVLSIRKTVYQKYSNESLRQRQRYRHEMAKERRARMESQKLMNLKIKELKEKEKEISRRYARRNNYGSLNGASSSLKSKFKEERKDDSSVTVLLPVLKKKDGSSRFESSFNEGLDYGEYSIPKTMLPPGNEDISAYEVVKAAQEICAKYKNNDYEDDNDCELENGVRGEENEQLDKENLKLKRLVIEPVKYDEEKTVLTKENLVKRKKKKTFEPHIIPLPSYRNGVDTRKQLKQQKNTFPRHNLGPCYESFYYPNERGDQDDDRLPSLAVLGKANNTNTYELLIVDDGPRSEEIRVKQKCCLNSRTFDILFIREKLPKSPNAL